MAKSEMREDLIKHGSILQEELLQVLKPREYSYYLRYINGETYQSIADTEGVSRERIRQIMNNALRRMRRKIRKMSIALDMISTGVDAMIEKDISSVKVTSEVSYY